MDDLEDPQPTPSAVDLDLHLAILDVLMAFDVATPFQVRSALWQFVSRAQLPKNILDESQQGAVLRKRIIYFLEVGTVTPQEFLDELKAFAEIEEETTVDGSRFVLDADRSQETAQTAEEDAELDIPVYFEEPSPVDADDAVPVEQVMGNLNAVAGRVAGLTFAGELVFYKKDPKRTPGALRLETSVKTFVPNPNRLLRLKTAMGHDKEISLNEIIFLFEKLKYNFHYESHKNLHREVCWEVVEAALTLALTNCPNKLWGILQLIYTGGEPDVIGVENGNLLFCDCSPEVPIGRRDCVFDQRAQEDLAVMKRQGIKITGSFGSTSPTSNAVLIARIFGAKIIHETQCLQLHEKILMDTNTVTWVVKDGEDLQRSSPMAYVASRKGSNILFDPIDARTHGSNLGVRLVIELPLAA